jgi:hypothetical protein
MVTPFNVLSGLVYAGKRHNLTFTRGGIGFRIYSLTDAAFCQRFASVSWVEERNQALGKSSVSTHLKEIGLLRRGEGMAEKIVRLSGPAGLPGGQGCGQWRF